MSVNPIWPSGTSEIVLWLQLVCTWIIATYAIVFDWTRQSPGDPPPKREGFVLSIATLFAVVSGLSLPPWGTSICARLGLAAVGAALVAITGFLRRMLRSVSLGDLTPNAGPLRLRVLGLMNTPWASGRQASCAA